MIVWIHNSTTEIKRRIKQVCFLSPYLFNLFIKEIIDKLKRKSKGINLNEENKISPIYDLWMILL